MLAVPVLLVRCCLVPVSLTCSTEAMLSVTLFCSANTSFSSRS